jgi:hypothetical protein
MDTETAVSIPFLIARLGTVLFSKELSKRSGYSLPLHRNDINYISPIETVYKVHK